MLNYVKAEKIWLKNHPELNEVWLRERIVEDPQILGLGDLEIKDVERSQPSAGRLDLLLQDSEAGKRYEVELMLGAVNESHIIRCIEYWDIERKRYPQYDHTAVLVAEDVTTRFLNVIGLFNNSIPMIAVQLNALKVDDRIILNFTKVLDEVIPGEDDEDGDGEVVDRDYWEKRGSKESLHIADSCLEIIHEFNPSLSLKYNKYYIGLADRSRAKNFVIFRAKKHFLRVEAKISEQQPWLERLEEVDLVILTGVKKRRRIIFRLEKDEVQKHRELLKELFGACYQEQQE
jgi:hypothetical protein